MNFKLRGFILSWVFFIYMAMITGLAAANGAPWPQDLTISPTAPNIPADLASFSGKWTTGSTSTMGIKIAFEKIAYSEFGLLKIDSVYAWNNRYFAAGWSRQPAQFNWKKVSFSIPDGNSLSGYIITCSIPKSDSMYCTYAGRFNGSLNLRREK